MKTVVEKPKIGNGATEITYSDCHAYTVIKVSPSGKTIWLQKMKLHYLMELIVVNQML